MKLKMFLDTRIILLKLRNKMQEKKIMRVDKDISISILNITKL